LGWLPIFNGIARFEGLFDGVLNSFFEILLLLQYNQNGSFSLAYYAMLIAIFMILGAIDWALNFILFYGFDVECNVIARLKGKDGKCVKKSER
jgi:cellulose synthase/poly-beta-1,6-N-acetylglucosamine synthase-like glycosyltransferase